MTTSYHMTLKSRNVKTGPIPVTTTSAKTCPPSCAFINAGCYAKGGPLGMHWDKVTKGTRGGSLDALCEQIKTLPSGTFWRHNQAGDLPGEGDVIDQQGLYAITKANHGKRGFTYTHKPMTPANALAVKAANIRGFTVNLSANTLDHADALVDHNVGPVVVVLASDATENTVTPKGRKVVVCPATQRDDVTCASCQLCQRKGRDCIVGFPAHGVSHKKATAVALS